MNINGQKGHISSTPPVETNYLTVKEDIVPVRATDLQHLKRDIEDIPSGGDAFDNAFWGFLGFGVSSLMQLIGAKWPDPVFVANLVAALAFIGVAILFKFFASKTGDNRSKIIKHITENIDDFSRNAQ